METNRSDDHYSSEKAFLHTQQAGAILPLLQSVITGALVGLLALAVLLVLRARDAWIWALLIGLSVTTLVWAALQLHWYWLTRIEKMTGMDLNGDGMIGQEPARETSHTVRVNVEEIRQGHVRIVTARFPVDEWMMQDLAKGLLAGIPFAERHWTGRGKPFSLREFRLTRDEMLKRGLIRPVSEKSNLQGYELTKTGLAVMRQLAGSHSPTPDENGLQS